MNDQKIENLLNLALQSTELEREKSLSLNVGYDVMDSSWELIVKYHGDPEQILIKMEYQIVFEDLSGGYAIVTIPEALINRFALLEEIEYIEKPKRLFFSVNRGKTISCIYQEEASNQVTGTADRSVSYLSGEGVLVALIDSGLSYDNIDFRNEDGSTRILWFWDQTKENGVYSEEEINRALQTDSSTMVSDGSDNTKSELSGNDITGHGTAVAAIAAGNGANSSGQYRGVAYKSSLLAVKLGSARPEGFPRTTQVMRALKFCIEKALEVNMPLAVNMSFGNTYGSHQGDSLLETYINHMAGVWKTVICIGSGNEGAAGGHTGGTLTDSVREIELAVSQSERTISIQLWKNYADQFSIEIVSPDGSRVMVPVLGLSQGTWRYAIDETELLVYLGEPNPYSVLQEIYFDFLPVSSYINSGIWTIILTPIHIVSGSYNLYLPSESILNTETRFLYPNADRTLTIPSVASEVITVAAYNSTSQAYAPFSGRGFTDFIPFSGAYKPTITAPGVDIISATTTGSYASFTGTSFATPFVTGAAALLMEWGIVRGNDPYLYGEKVKAFFIRGARQLPRMESPNPMTGWGALCVKGSLPI